MDDILSKLCGTAALTPGGGADLGEGRTPGHGSSLVGGEVGMTGMTLSVDGETYVLGADPYLLGHDSVTLADDAGLTIYSDTDGDGAVDYLTTVRFDGSFGAWRQVTTEASDVVFDAEQSVCKQTWDGGAWEEVEAGKWVP